MLILLIEYVGFGVTIKRVNNIHEWHIQDTTTKYSKI